MRLKDYFYKRELCICMKNYIDIPIFTTLKDIINKEYTLSARQYKSLQIKNKNLYPLTFFLDRKLQKKDLGSEVGGESYVDKSPFLFIKTRALQRESYLLDMTDESVKYVMPQKFINMNLKAGDLLISKDSNVGEIVILEKDYPHAMLCGGIYKLPIIKYKYYLLAFIKSDLFRQQIEFVVPRGATIKHGKTKFLDCLIPLPNKNQESVILYIELLVQAIINKEVEIRKKYKQILLKIHRELEDNQKDKVFVFDFPTIQNIQKTGRLDSSLYTEKFKRNEFLIKNYKLGTLSLKELGFVINRGQNLQVSCIGNSIYSDKKIKGFYKLIRPTNISKYGTVSKYEYLGNKNNLFCLKIGDIVFGAEATFRSLAILGIDDKIITNIHGVVLSQKDTNIVEAIFVKLMLDYYLINGLTKAYAVGGNGGSLAIIYLESIVRFPNFPKTIKKEITSLYFNKIDYKPYNLNMEDFIEYDQNFNEKAGIYDLDLALKYLQEKLTIAIESIVNDEDVEINF